MNHDNDNILISNIDTSSERLPSNIALNPLTKLFFYNNFNKKKTSNYHNFINLQQIKNYFSKLQKTKLINHTKVKDNIIPKRRENSAKNIFNNKQISSCNYHEQSSSLNMDKIKNHKNKITKIIRLNKSSSAKNKLNRNQSMKIFRKISLNKKLNKKNSDTPKTINKKTSNSIPKSNSIEKTTKINKNIPHPKTKNNNTHNKTANNFYKINNLTRKTNLTIPIKYNFYKKAKNIKNHSYIVYNNNQNDSLQQQSSSYLNSRNNNNISSENNKNEEHYYSYFKENTNKIFDVRKHLSDYYILKSKKRNSSSNNIQVKKINYSKILIPSFMIKKENKSDNNTNNYINNNIKDNMDKDNSINDNKYEYTFKNCNNNDCGSINNDKEKSKNKQFDRRKEDLLQLIYFSNNLRKKSNNIKL